jgi:hypothetical protein
MRHRILSRNSERKILVLKFAKKKKPPEGYVLGGLVVGIAPHSKEQTAAIMTRASKEKGFSIGLKLKNIIIRAYTETQNVSQKPRIYLNFF